MIQVENYYIFHHSNLKQDRQWRENQANSVWNFMQLTNSTVLAVNQL